MNCLCTAGYVLYMKHATKTVRLSKFGMVFYNNLLSLPILLGGALLRGEFPTLLAADELHTVPYLTLSLYAGLVGFFLNLATLWCVSNNSATTYAVVGALNKVPLAIVGCVMCAAGAGMTGSGAVRGGDRSAHCASHPQTHARDRWLLFQTPITGKGLTFLSLSMCGGFLYTYTKIREAQRQPQPTLPR